MRESLLEQLRIVTEEEQKILSGETNIEKSIYTSESSFIVDKKKMLEKGKLIDLRTHTRFIHFPPHRHNYIEIIYMCSGSTTHMINKKQEVVLKKGDLLFLNQNAVQEIMPAGMQDIAVNFLVLPEFFNQTFELIQDTHSVWDFFSGALQSSKSTTDYLLFRVSDILPVQNLMENMIWSLINKQTNRRNIYQMTMTLLLLHLANHMDRLELQEVRQYDQEMMSAVVRYVEERYMEGSLTELANAQNLSLPSMSKYIKSKSGHTFQQLIQQKRLNQAALLLSTTRLTVEEVISAVGYDNTSYFHRIFKEKYGCTPKKYRQNTKK
ncbi:MAG: AraC family transcriptional regulator [Lachnospiraceae bacterium]